MSSVEKAKIIGVELFLIIVSVVGYIAYFVDNNLRALTWGIACSVAFVIFNSFLLCFIIGTKKERENE